MQQPVAPYSYVLPPYPYSYIPPAPQPVQQLVQTPMQEYTDEAREGSEYAEQLRPLLTKDNMNKAMRLADTGLKHTGKLRK